MTGPTDPALRALVEAWTEGVEPGPWTPAHRPGGPIVLDNPTGDSLFVDAPDAALLVNDLLDRLAAAEAAPLDVEDAYQSRTVPVDVVIPETMAWPGSPADDMAYRRGHHDGWVTGVKAALRSPDTETAEPERRQLADNLIDAVEEALQAEALPANVHRRLQVAYDDVVEEANR
jgi:hypothetical protein